MVASTRPQLNIRITPDLKERLATAVADYPGGIGAYVTDAITAKLDQAQHENEFYEMLTDAMCQPIQVDSDGLMDLDAALAATTPLDHHTV